MQRRGGGDRDGQAPRPVFKKTPQKSGSPVLLSSSCSGFSSLHPGFLPGVGSGARVKHGIVSLALNLFQCLFIADTMMDKAQKVCRVPASLLSRGSLTSSLAGGCQCQGDCFASLPSSSSWTVNIKLIFWQVVTHSGAGGICSCQRSLADGSASQSTAGLWRGSPRIHPTPIDRCYLEISAHFFLHLGLGLSWREWRIQRPCVKLQGVVPF